MLVVASETPGFPAQAACQDRDPWLPEQSVDDLDPTAALFFRQGMKTLKQAEQTPSFQLHARLSP